MPGGTLGRQPIDPKLQPYVGKTPETGGTTGGSSPQAPDPEGDGVVAYVPFSNAELKWEKPDSDAGKPPATRTPGTKPAVLLLVGKDDGTSCCAEFFEREVFSDPECVKYAKANLVAVRIDRLSDAAKPFNLKNTSALILEDCEGDEVSRLTACRDANIQSVLSSMKEAVTRSDKIKATTKELTPLLQKATQAITDGKVRDAVTFLLKAQKEKLLSHAMKDKVAALKAAIDDAAQKRLDSAQGWVDAGDPGHAWALDKQIAEDFDGLQAATQAREAMKALETDPRSKARVRESRAQDALDAAIALAKEGKKAKAEQALKAVAKDFDGTKAAQEATKLAAEVGDPNWKPAEQVEGK